MRKCRVHLKFYMELIILVFSKYLRPSALTDPANSMPNSEVLCRMAKNMGTYINKEGICLPVITGWFHFLTLVWKECLLWFSSR